MFFCLKLVQLSRADLNTWSETRRGLKKVFDRGRVLLGILGGDVPSVSLNPDPTSDQKIGNFPDPFSDQTSKIHSRFQTWALGRNYVIITYIRAQTKKNSSNSF